MVNTQELITADYCVIGGGSAGLSFAAGAVQMGATVILIESHKMGGDCLNYGCVPSKALLAASRFGADAIQAGNFGWSLQDLKVDYHKIYEHIHKVIANIAPNDSIERFEKLGVQVIIDSAKFIDAKTIETTKYIIKAKRFIVATGSTPFVPPISGLENVTFYTNETIFDLTVLPQELVVIGGGPIGIELAQAFHNLGSKVTVLEAFTALPKDDPELTNSLKQMLRQQGINIKEHMQIEAVQQVNDKIQFSCIDENSQKLTIFASHVLVAAGRRANIQHLNLAAAKIAVTPQGIVVDKSLRTSNDRVYAIGDCVGGLQFTHVAGYHAGLVIRNSIFKLWVKVQTNAIPWVTYVEPELAHVGLLESQAIQQGIAHKVLKLSFAENDRAQAENRTNGIIKAVVSPKGYILGVSILGHNAGELIYPWVIAINNNLKLSAIASSIAPYPTLNDISKRLAGNFYTAKIFSPAMHKIVKLLMSIT